MLHLAGGTIDVAADLAPSIMDATWNMAPFPGQVVACCLVGAVWQPATLETCVHFVAAMTLQSHLPLRGSGVVAHMGRQGFATIMTQANSDCGIESLLVLADSRRGPMERSALRERMQRFLCNAARDPAWQDAFIAAG